MNCKMWLVKRWTCQHMKMILTHCNFHSHTSPYTLSFIPRQVTLQMVWNETSIINLSSALFPPDQSGTPLLPTQVTPSLEECWPLLTEACPGGQWAQYPGNECRECLQRCAQEGGWEKCEEDCYLHKESKTKLLLNEWLFKYGRVLAAIQEILDNSLASFPFLASSEWG